MPNTIIYDEMDCIELGSFVYERLEEECGREKALELLEYIRRNFESQYESLLHKGILEAMDYGYKISKRMIFEMGSLCCYEAYHTEQLRDAIKKYLKDDVDVIALHKDLKIPQERGWTTKLRKTYQELKSQVFRRGFNNGRLSYETNIGTRTGLPSCDKNGMCNIVIDMDVKSPDPKHKKEAEACVREILGDDLEQYPSVITGRGMGSRHYYTKRHKDRLPKSRKYRTSKELVRVYMPSADPSVRDKKMLSAAEIQDGYRIRPAWEVEILSTGKQAVLPPSVHPDTGEVYKWA